MTLRKFYLFTLLLLMAACTPKESNVAEQVLVDESKPIKLKVDKAVDNTVYVLARHNTSNMQSIQASIEQGLQQKGYKIAQGPSEAGYIVHITVPSMGIHGSTWLQSNIKAGYGAPIKNTISTNEEDKHFVIIADVLIVARTIPTKLRSRPAVISTTSKPSKVAEASARIVASAKVENEDDTFDIAKMHLEKNISQKIVASLPQP